MSVISIENTNYFICRKASHSLEWLEGLLKAPIPTHHLDTSTGESISIASSELATLYESTQPERLTRETILSLFKYLLRGATRPTPFGGFSGVGQGFFSSQWTAKNTQLVPSHRLDSSVHCFLVTLLTRQYRTQLGYRLNNSIYSSYEEIRFSERLSEGGGAFINLYAYPQSELMGRLIGYGCSQETYRPYQDWKAFLLSDDVLTDAEADDYLTTLIDDGFLQPELTLQITAPDSTGKLISIINRFDSLLANGLAVVVDPCNAMTRPQRLQQLDSLLRAAVERYRRATGLLAPELPKYRLQTDAFLSNADLQIPTRIAQTIQARLAELAPLIEAPVSSELSAFAERFRSRFAGQAIPLLQALDPLLGVGFDTGSRQEDSLLNQLDLAGNPEPVSQGSAARRKLVEALYFQKTSSNKVELTDQLLVQLPPAPQRAYSSWAFGELYQSDLTTQPTKGRGNSLFHLRSMGGPSVATLIGRFCYGLPDITGKLQAALQKEADAYPGQILAEVVHLPADRSGNITARPPLRAYEIPYISPAGVDDQHTIPLADLTVRVVGNEVILESIRNRCRVRPRLSNAHNTRLGDEVYRFLSAVAGSDSRVLRFSWHHLSQLPHLPRVEYRSILLSRERWYIDPAAASPYILSDVSSVQWYWSLPERFVLAQGDNELFFDLSNPYCCALFLAELRTGRPLTIFEWLPQSFTPWLVDEGQRFCSELIIPLDPPKIRTPAPAFRPTSVPTARLKRTFVPGSEWLYLKVYGSDEALEHVLAQLWTTETPAPHFFFIRYNDPQRHLRLRWPIAPAAFSSHYERILHTLEPLLDAHLISQIELGTYEREIERYGEPFMEMCESIFIADSRCMQEWLVSNRYATDRDRYKFALWSIDYMLSALEWSIARRCSFFERLQTDFVAEFGGTPALRKSLNQLYRKEAPDLFAPPAVGASYTRLFDSLCSYWRTLKNGFAQHETSNQAADGIVGSLIHMHLNRLFLNESRQHELLVYHVLTRHYTSIRARVD